MTTTSVTRDNITLVQDDVDFPAAYDAKSGAGNYVPGAGPTAAYCTNVSCHGGQNTPVWDGGTLDVNTCSLCHVGRARGEPGRGQQWNSAWSGLHGRIGSVSLENHTDGRRLDRRPHRLGRLHRLPLFCRRSTSPGSTRRPRTR